MNSVHPGTVNSDLTRHSTLMTIFFSVFATFLKTPREGAQTSIYCALAEELHAISGKHFRWVWPQRRGQRSGGFGAGRRGDLPPKLNAPSSADHSQLPPSSDCSDCAPAFVAPQGRSQETARRLWEVSCELLGVQWD